MLREFIEIVPTIKEHLYRENKLYVALEKVLVKEAEELFGPNGDNVVDLNGIGTIDLPFFSMGAIGTSHLFGIDELILFSFYSINSKNYKKVADIGANIGLHSIVLGKLGYEVSAYEPDPGHCKQFQSNMNCNSLGGKVNLQQKAVSDIEKRVNYIIVKGNTTSSHISGAKKNPYGELQEISVQTENFKKIMDKHDFIKADVEGHEAKLITSTTEEDWDNCDAVFEIGSVENAEAIFEYLNSIDVNLFSQKIGWNRVEKVDEVPKSHREGSVFISRKTTMNWY